MAAAVDPATLHDEKLGFGKHRDKSFAEAAADADYVEWALSMDRPKGRLATFCNYIKQTVAAPKVAVPSAEPVAPSKDSDSEDDQPLKSRGVTARAVAKKRVRAEEESKPDAVPAADEVPAGGVAVKESAPPAKATEDVAMAEPQAADESSEDDEPLAARKKAKDLKGKKVTAKEKPKRAAPEAGGEEEAGGEGEGEEESDDEEPDSNSIALAITLAKNVLARGARGDYEGVLSLVRRRRLG